MIRSLLLVLFIFSLHNNVIPQDLIFSRELLSLPVDKTEIIVTNNKLPKQKIDVRTYIPVNAFKYLPILKQEQVKYWSSHPMPETLAGLAEQESCISLVHKKCWSPDSKLETKRELGSGIFQVTKAYRKDGSIRFDTLTDLKNAHPALQEWSWENVYKRPDLQIRAMLLMNVDNYKLLSNIKDPIIRLHFTDASYNAGLGNVNDKRRICKLSSSCDPQQWFDNVENSCRANQKPIYGTRTACDIVRDHTFKVFQVRSEKYKPYML